jgi:hypothetical protein
LPLSISTILEAVLTVGSLQRQTLLGSNIRLSAAIHNGVYFCGAGTAKCVASLATNDAYIDKDAKVVLQLSAAPLTGAEDLVVQSYVAAMATDMPMTRYHIRCNYDSIINDGVNGISLG